MRKALIGFLFILLDVSFDIVGHNLELLPDFVGFILLALGLGELAAESPRFGAARLLAWTLAGLSGAYWFADLLGVFNERQWLSVGLGLGLWALTLYVVFETVRGVRDTEVRRDCNLNAAALKAVWIVMAAFAALSYVSLFFPGWGVLLSVASFVVGLVFLGFFYKTKKLYEEVVREDQPSAWGTPPGQETAPGGDPPEGQG